MKTPLPRRHFLSLTASAVAGVLVESALATTDVPVQAIAVDAFLIFDPRPIFALVEELFPARGAELSKAWRTRQFEYTWLRTLAGRYVDFWQVTEDALVFAAIDLKLDLDPQKRARLINAYLELKAWPDVPQAAKSLRGPASGWLYYPIFPGKCWKQELKTPVLVECLNTSSPPTR